MSSFPLLSFLITLLLAAAVCTHGNKPVKDINGNEVVYGEKYFIQPVNTNSNGGLIPETINLSYCALGITQAPPDQAGVAVSFGFPQGLLPPPIFPPSLLPQVDTNSYITIEFMFETNFCKEDLSKIWEVHEFPFYPNPQTAIFIGGNPRELNSHFKIEKVGEGETNIYKLTTHNGTVGAVTQPSGELRLVLAKDTDETILVQFSKVNDATTAVTSTSRVKKLGLRMFPF